MDHGHWLLKENVEIDESVFGFIYEIINNINKKIYIGKKQCKSKIKKAPLKGKKNKRIELKESDWKNYTSSSVELNQDIQKYGKENFTFIILRACYSKWELAYYEIKEQIEREVLFKEEYYNGIINVRIGRPPKNFLKKNKNHS
jgi:hypothetical protein